MIEIIATTTVEIISLKTEKCHTLMKLKTKEHFFLLVNLNKCLLYGFITEKIIQSNRVNPVLL